MFYFKKCISLSHKQVHMFVIWADFFITHICTLMYLHELIFVEFIDIYLDLKKYRKELVFLSLPADTSLELAVDSSIELSTVSLKRLSTEFYRYFCFQFVWSCYRQLSWAVESWYFEYQSIVDIPSKLSTWELLNGQKYGHCSPGCRQLNRTIKGSMMPFRSNFK